MREMQLSEVKCPYCKSHLNKACATVDHIIPKSKPHCGAKSDYRNLIWACGTCNNVMKTNRVFLKKTKKTNISTIVGAQPQFVIIDAKARAHYINGIAGVICKELYRDDPVE